MLMGNVAVQKASVVTMDPRRPRAEALAVRDGHIVAVGSWSEVEPFAADLRVLDLPGKTVVPGLIDTHAHFLGTALSLAMLNLRDIEDRAGLAAVLRSAAADTPPGEVIVGRGLDERILCAREGEPLIDLLDAVAPEHPVHIIGVGGHVSGINSAALALAALPPGTPGVVKGASGRATGTLADRANSMARRRINEAFGADQKSIDMLGAAVERAHAAGATTVHALEGSLSGDDPVVDAFLAAMPELPMRFVLYYQTMDVDRVLSLDLPRIGGCILLDGDVEPHTAAFTEPYADDLSCYGTLYHTQEEVDAFVLRAHRAGLQVAMHAIGDAAIDQGLDAYAAALETQPRPNHRHRLEHCDAIRDDQIERARELGVAIAIQPPFNYYWPHSTYYPALGEKRGARIDPFATMLHTVDCVAGGSDSPVTPLEPLTGVHAAVNHSRPEQRVSVQEALQIYTVNAACIAFEEEDKGSLAPGKLGDFVVLGADPFAVDPGELKDIPVELTVVGGRIVYSRA